jgi:hypothetical protein
MRRRDFCKLVVAGAAGTLTSSWSRVSAKRPGPVDLNATVVSLPHISIRKGLLGANFVLQDKSFIAKGFNYIVLRDHDHATFDAATKTTTANYNATRAEAMFARLRSYGYNTVRVFIVGGREPANPGIAGNYATTRGVYAPYMDNVIDFLRRGRRHGIYVIPTFGDGELPNNHYYQSLSCQTCHGPNAFYFAARNIAAKEVYVNDFLAYLKQNAPETLATLLGIELQNEVCVYSNNWPFTVTRGSLKMPNGKAYNMAASVQRRALMNEGLQYYMNRVTAAAKAVVPDLLVAQSVFTNTAVGKNLASENYLGVWPGPYPDKRFPPDLVTLGESLIDFMDIHYYPTMRHHTHTAIPHNFRVNLGSSLYYEPKMKVIRQSKPVILGEFGAYKFVTKDITQAARYMVEVRNLALAAGLRGFLYWTYDSKSQSRLYYATDDGGIILKGLAEPT